MSSYARVLLAHTGDGRRAVFERGTSEPVQYVMREESEDKLLQQWDEYFEMRMKKREG